MDYHRQAPVLTALAAGLALSLLAGRADAAPLAPLEVAYAGSMGSMMSAGIRPAIAASLGAELRGRAQGSSALANLIAADSIRPDVFIAITPGPMKVVLRAGKAERAIPIARTEMVIAYASRSRFAGSLAKSAEPGAQPWWRILASGGFRFGRTDPHTDPQGLNIIFTMQLATTYYNQPDLAQRVLGATINPPQIFPEPELMARLQAGQLDASSAYKPQATAFGLPFLTLPQAINLGDPAMAARYAAAGVSLDGRTAHPEPLVFYAAALKDGSQPRLAERFLAWLSGSEARAIFARFHYDDAGNAAPLAP